MRGVRWLVLLVAGAAALGGAASAQVGTAQPVSQRKAEIFAALLRPVEIEIRDQRVGDVITFFERLSEQDFEVITTEESDVGIDPEQAVTFSVRSMTILQAIERLLRHAERGQGLPYGSFEWQFADYGGLQLGNKEDFDRAPFTAIYDIQDLLLEIPDYDEVPEIELSEEGEDPFQGRDQDDDEDRPTREELAQELIDIITENVETEHWEINGGSGGQIRHFRGTLIVRAPDYMQREINGYEWWPAGLSERGRPVGLADAGRGSGGTRVERVPGRTRPVVVPEAAEPAVASDVVPAAAVREEREFRLPHIRGLRRMRLGVFDSGRPMTAELASRLRYEHLVAEQERLVGQSVRQPGGDGAEPAPLPRDGAAEPRDPRKPLPRM